MTATKEAYLAKQGYQAPAGVVFVDVGKTDPKTYLQQMPERDPTRTITGQVVSVNPGSASSVAIVRPKSGPEVAAVVSVGVDVPTIGASVSVEISGGVASVMAKKK